MNEEVVFSESIPLASRRMELLALIFGKKIYYKDKEYEIKARKYRGKTYVISFGKTKEEE